MSWAVWITGRPGSGESAIARAAATAIGARGEAVTVLELDEMRRLVTPMPSYIDAERALVYRGLVYVAATLVSAGVPVIIDATAHRREWRDAGNAPIGIYARAGTSGTRVPGVDVPYEAATMPELTIDTTTKHRPRARLVSLTSSPSCRARRDATPARAGPCGSRACPAAARRPSRRAWRRR